MKISTIKNVHILFWSLALTLFLNFGAAFASNGNRCLNEDLDITNNLCEQNARHLALENNLSFVDNIFLGIGPNNFRYDCSNPIYNVSKWSCSTHPHSTFFQILAEVGLLGFLIVYSVLVYFVYKSVILVFSKNISHKSFGIYSLQCAIIIYLFPPMITGNFFLSWYGFIYFLPISLFMVYSSKI